VACGMCLGALGTQTGGSIIRPASYCGVAGFKPTYGAVRSDGIVPLAPSLDHPGAIARTAQDLVLLGHEIVIGDSGDCNYPPPDPAFTPEKFGNRVSRILPSQRRLRIPKLRRLRGFHDRHVEPVMREAFDGALAALVEAGAEVTDLDDEACDFEGILRGHRAIMAAEAAAEHESRFAEYRDDYLPQIRELIEEGLATPVTRYIRCHQEHLRFNLSQRLETRLDLEALVTPATMGPAPDASTTGSPTLNLPWSYLGTPTVSIPIGLSPEGLPLALQLVGDRYLGSRIGDYALLNTAVWCETALRRAYSRKE
jgi:Asp-tRNA(Asn)/Glu-tRNA(Gln) amidotransferase A subunit family amidase